MHLIGSCALFSLEFMSNARPLHWDLATRQGSTLDLFIAPMVYLPARRLFQFLIQGQGYWGLLRAEGLGPSPSYFLDISGPPQATMPEILQSIRQWTCRLLKTQPIESVLYIIQSYLMNSPTLTSSFLLTQKLPDWVTQILSEYHVRIWMDCAHG